MAKTNKGPPLPFPEQEVLSLLRRAGPRGFKGHEVRGILEGFDLTDELLVHYLMWLVVAVIKAARESSGEAREQVGEAKELAIEQGADKLRVINLMYRISTLMQGSKGEGTTQMGATTTGV